MRLLLDYSNHDTVYNHYDNFDGKCMSTVIIIIIICYTELPTRLDIF